jgi:transcriptional regulator with XRE-family HTH domain
LSLTVPLQDRQKVVIRLSKGWSQKSPKSPNNSAIPSASLEPYLSAWEVQMKIKRCPRRGALSELLKKKGMTQIDAFALKCADRKTLLRIDRGEEVKLETLQQVANKLGVPEEYFLPPSAPEGNGDVDVPEQGAIMLRRLDAARLEELLEGAERVEWHLNAKVSDEEARKFLKNFETVVGNYHRNLRLRLTDPANPTLRVQLDRLKITDDLAARLELFAGHRLALLGADHLFWQCHHDEGEFGELNWWPVAMYSSPKKVLLSVEPHSTQSRRMLVFIGDPPPLFAPDTQTVVFVNGVHLPSREGEEPPFTDTG